MVIQIIGSTLDSKQNASVTTNIVEAIQESGETAHILLETDKNKSSKTDWTKIYKETLNAIAHADLVIVDATRYGFLEGFYASQALQHKKPLLLLAPKDSDTPPLDDMKDRFLNVKYYDTIDAIKGLVSTFLGENAISAKDLRFNFFLDRQLYSYLREESRETGKNKSEIIRELLKKEIESRDK